MQTDKQENRCKERQTDNQTERKNDSQTRDMRIGKQTGKGNK